MKAAKVATIPKSPGYIHHPSSSMKVELRRSPRNAGTVERKSKTASFTLPPICFDYFIYAV
jgi:hypothetical protein